MKNKFTLAKSEEIEIRNAMVEDFVTSCIDFDERPFVITDEATLYNFYLEDEAQLFKRVQEKYGKALTAEHLNMPFWKLLDYIYK